MESHATISGNKNIVIQGITDATITVNVNGVPTKIDNQLKELKSLLEKLNTENFFFADKKYNINHVDQSNFKTVTSPKLFNSILCRRLIKEIEKEQILIHIQDQYQEDKKSNIHIIEVSEDIIKFNICQNDKQFPFESINNFELKNKELQSFLTDIHYENEEGWDTNKNQLNEAQEILENSYVWILSYELRRLFSIGNDKRKTLDVKVKEYIDHCIKTYRLSIQIVNYILISKLWDIKKVNPNLKYKNPNLKSLLSKFFLKFINCFNK